VGRRTLAFVPLSGCGGCEVQFMRVLAAHPELEEIYDIVYWPFVVEETSFPERVDVAVVEGSVRTRENLEALRRARAAADKLIVLGSCASFGGVNGQADYWPVGDSLRALYGGALSEAPEMLERVYAPPDLVPVDYVVSRCPPLLSVIYRLLVAIHRGEAVEGVETSVCAQCPRSIKEIERLEFKKSISEVTDPDTCFLSQGYICLGSVTNVGCGAPCTRHGMPCFGCGGPIGDIMTRRDEDIVEAVARKIAALAGLDPAKDTPEIAERLVETYGARRFYIFTLASNIIREKPGSYAVDVLSETRLERGRVEEMLRERGVA